MSTPANDDIKPDSVEEAPIETVFVPRTFTRYGGLVGVEFETADHSVMKCGPLRAEFHEA